LFIELNRQFVEWREQDGELSDPEVYVRFGLVDKAKSWPDLHKFHRVVVLAEAGGGKTDELKGQARRLSADGAFAFYAAVQDLGREGLDASVNGGVGRNRAALAAWRASEEPAWFFLDSIDEAKLDNVRLERALARLAEAITGAEARVHIVLAGRHTDWEFRRDLKRLEEALPGPTFGRTVAPPNPSELLVKVIRHEEIRPAKIEREAPVVVVLVPLDATGVRLFASGKGAPNLDSFLSAIDEGNLWQFARRPLDLDWLVQFWITNNRLGSLAEMLANSLTERLQEKNLDRARRDPLTFERAMAALERIGAALVFGRKTTIAIPDSEIVLSDSNRPLDLDDVSPDLGADERSRLLNRPVFDPATFGRARLHNDNQAVVRAYLTARWLHRLRRANLSQRTLFDLLFAETYGIKLVKPSLQETAAWLSLWDDDVAQEVIRRAPHLLLTAGDPASLSAVNRANALTQLIERTANGDEAVPMLDPDSVKRFSKPELSSTVRVLWEKHKGHEAASLLLLRIMWFGRFTECADLATEAAFDDTGGHYRKIMGGRAVMATGDDSLKRQYAERIVSRCTSLPPTAVWDAIDNLFPAVIGVDELLEIIRQIDLADRDGGGGFEWRSPKLIEKLADKAALERLLAGLMDLLGADETAIGHIPDGRERALLSATKAASYQLLVQVPNDETPDVVIDAVVRVSRLQRYGAGDPWERTGDARAQLRRTPGRRRKAFWRGAATMESHRYLRGKLLEWPWEMQFLGWTPPTELSDVDWLLEDTPRRTAENERKLGTNTLLAIWRDAGRPDDLRARIESVAQTNAAMSASFNDWMNPPPPNPELEESERKLRELQERNAAERENSERNWIEFVEELKTNPDQLRHLRPATSEGIDRRLFYLWQLLQSATRSTTAYGIDTVVAAVPFLGEPLAAALRDGLINHWRTWEPRSKTAREPDKRNSFSSLDAMGIAGVALDAATRPSWANTLDADLARRAVVYSTLEIGGFGKWIANLSAQWPQQVRDVLLREIQFELDDPATATSFGVLGDLVRADSGTVRLMANSLLAELARRADLPTAILHPLVTAVACGGDDQDRERLRTIALSRFASTNDPAVASLYIGACFDVDAKSATDDVDAKSATDALLQKLDDLDASEQKRLVQHVLPQIFGDRFSDRVPPELAFGDLLRLVRIAFKTILVEEDNFRPSGEAYSPDDRDRAEGARSAAFNKLASMPGRATFDALPRLSKQKGFPIPAQRLRELARWRAEQDSESAPWPPGEAAVFEASFQLVPQTSLDLQRLLFDRFDDWQHQLLNRDFAQGGTLASLPLENDVQNWVADRLRNEQGRSYSIEREPHVVDEKEPDIRARSPATDASVPIEIKVAEAWTLTQLEDALTKQLCGRYLRAREGKHGILLLVHQKPRARGWRNARTGKSLTFEQVVPHLRAIAERISGKSPDDPQPVVAAIDVSSRFAALKSKRRVVGRKRQRIAGKKPQRQRVKKRSKVRKRT
jgi:hypothetical protein